MVSMAGGASGRAEIAADGQRIVMNAGAIFCELIRGNGISLHVRGVRVAPGTGLRDVERMNSRAGVAGGAQSMNTMAIDAHCHLGVALGKKFAVHAGLVLAELVGAQ